MSSALARMAKKKTPTTTPAKTTKSKAKKTTTKKSSPKKLNSNGKVTNTTGVTPEGRDAFLDHITSKLQVQVLDEEDLSGPVARIPFTSPMMTWATTGGVKLGQTVRWFGEEGSGKSITNLGLIHSAQHFPEVLEQQFERRIKILEMRPQSTSLARVKLKKDYKKLAARHPEPLSVLLIDAEGRFEAQLAQEMGITVSKDTCYPVFENIIETVIEMTKEAFKQRAYDIVILDSAAACDSVEKMGKEPGEYDRAANARAWSSRFNRITRASRLYGGTFVVVDQVRTQGGGGGGMGGGALQKQTIPPNIRILKHQSSLSAEYDMGKKLYIDKHGHLTDDYEKASDDFPHLGTKGKEPHGLEMRCKIIKNSTGRPYRSARTRFKFPAVNKHNELVQETGFDEPFELFESALEFGMLEQSGSYYYRLDEKGKRTKHKAMQGDANVHVKIAEDEEWAEAIRLKLVSMT